MDPVQGRAELPLHFRKRQSQRGTPPDQDVIVAISHAVAGSKVAGRKVTGRKSDDFAQPPPHPVTLHRIANLPRYCETDANAAVAIITQPRLQYKTAGRCPQAARCGAKISPASQPLHRGSNSCAADGCRLRTKPFASARPPRRQHLAATCGCHPRAKAMTAFAHQFARLIGPFHGDFSAARGIFARKSAVGAAYTKAVPARQSNR